MAETLDKAIDKTLETSGELYRGAKLAAPLGVSAGLATAVVEKLGVSEAAEQYGPAIVAFAVGALSRRVHAMVLGPEKAPSKVLRFGVASVVAVATLALTRSGDQSVLAAGSALAGISAQGAAERSADKTFGVSAAKAHSIYR